YRSFDEVVRKYEGEVSRAAIVIVGYFVPDGALVGEWVTSIASGATAFYDIDTPVTLAQLERGECEYVNPELIRRYHLYLSFTGGPVLRLLENRFGSPMARAMYCSVDSDLYRTCTKAIRWDMGYLGTYSPDRQPGLESLMIEPARRWSQGRFAVVGPM